MESARHDLTRNLILWLFSDNGVGPEAPQVWKPSPWKWMPRVPDEWRYGGRVSARERVRAALRSRPEATAWPTQSSAKISHEQESVVEAALGLFKDADADIVVRELATFVLRTMGAAVLNEFVLDKLLGLRKDADMNVWRRAATQLRTNTMERRRRMVGANLVGVRQRGACLWHEMGQMGAAAASQPVVFIDAPAFLTMCTRRCRRMLDWRQPR